MIQLLEIRAFKKMFGHLKDENKKYFKNKNYENIKQETITYL